LGRRVSVLVEITSLLGVKLAENVGAEPVRFDVSAKLEEKKRQSGMVVVLFGLAVRTKPSVVKYEVEGKAVLTGKDALIEKVLEVDPKSKIPFVFHRVYQHVFTAIYMLASLMGTIYPPPDLLSSGGQGIPVKSLKRAEQAERIEEAEAPREEHVAKATEPAESTEPAEPPEPAEPAESPEPAEQVEPVVTREETSVQQPKTSAT